MILQLRPTPIATEILQIGLILSGNTLYGTTYGGGTNGNGTVFAVNTDGTGFTVLHTFTCTLCSFYWNQQRRSQSGRRIDFIGQHPVWDGIWLAAANGNGTVFALNTDGMGFTNLHSFTALGYDFSIECNTNSDGANPLAD